MAAIVGCSGGGGRVITIDAQQAVPLTLSISYDGEQTDLLQLGVATEVRVSQQIAAQFQNALTDAIFVTPFGDAPGEIRVSFIANRRCDADETSSGFDVIQHYLDRRLLPDKNKIAASVIIGSGAFRSFLVGLVLGAANQQAIPIIQGSLVFRGWPE